MNKKTYSTPEVEIEKFSIVAEIVRTSGLENDNNFGGNEDWEF